MAYRTHNDNSFLPKKKKYERYVSALPHDIESQEGGRVLLTDLPLVVPIGGNAFPSGIRFIRPNDATISVGEIFYTVINGFTAVRLTGIFTTAQPGDNDLSAVLRKNGVNTAIQFTISAGFQNPAPVLGSVVFITGDTVSIRINNLSASASGLCTSITLSAS